MGLYALKGGREVLGVPILARPMDERLAPAMIAHMERHHDRVWVLIGMHPVGDRKPCHLGAFGQLPDEDIDGHHVLAQDMILGGHELDGPEETARMQGMSNVVGEINKGAALYSNG